MEFMSYEETMTILIMAAATLVLMLLRLILAYRHTKEA